jgi:two-component system invasion response regulator UvrY
MVNDHAHVRTELLPFLAQAFPSATFGEAGTGHEALASIRHQPWDAVLLDIAMSEGSALELLKLLVDARPNTAVLVLNMNPADERARQVLKSGAAGYLTRDSAAEEIVVALKQTLEGGHYISASLAEGIASGLSSLVEGGAHHALSERERQVLLFIASGKASKEIAYELSLSVKTVSTYRTRLLAKMKLTTNAELIRYALQNRLVD